MWDSTRKNESDAKVREDKARRALDKAENELKAAETGDLVDLRKVQSYRKSVQKAKTDLQQRTLVYESRKKFIQIFNIRELSVKIILNKFNRYQQVNKCGNFGFQSECYVYCKKWNTTVRYRQWKYREWGIDDEDIGGEGIEDNVNAAAVLSAYYSIK